MYRKTWAASVILFLALALLTGGCKDKTYLIAVSKGLPNNSYEAYYNWLSHCNNNTKAIDMYHIPFDSAMQLLEKCDGLLVTGGPDVHPARYGKGLLPMFPLHMVR